MIKINNGGKTERYTGEAISDKAKAFVNELPDCFKTISDNLKEEALKADAVNHPWHYNNGEYECIDAMEDCFGTEAVKGFCICNAFKYLWRCQEKHETPIEDIKKSVWYLDKFLELSKYD
jgi:hypothetical protein